MGSLKGKRDVLQIIGKNIKSIRISKGFTQEQLAEKINRSTNYISLIELGKSGINAPTIIDICNVLDVSSESLFKGLLDYKAKEKDRYITETISALNSRDKKIITDLMQYIMESREC